MVHGFLRARLSVLTSIATSLGEDRRESASQGRWLFWEAHSGGTARSRLTLADGRTRRWKAPGLERLVEVLNEPALAKALLLRRGFAPALVDIAALMFSGPATGKMMLSFNLDAISRNALLAHLLQAELTLRPASLAAYVAFDVMEKPGVRFAFEIERPLSWSTALVLRWRLDRTLRRLHMESLGPSSA